MPSPYVRSIWRVKSRKLVWFVSLCRRCCQIEHRYVCETCFDECSNTIVIPSLCFCLLFAAPNFTIHMTLGLLDSNGAFNGNYFSAEDEAEGVSILVNDTHNTYL